jgi:formate dehydrogenase subunit gamma
MIVPMKRVKVLRHDLFLRVLHWLIFIEGVVLTLSGLQLGGILGVTIFPTNNMSYHVMVGVAFVATATLFIYDMAVTGNYGWFGLSRIPYSFRFIFAETKGWFGAGPKPEEPIVYDTRKKRYVEKIVPSVILVFWIYVVLGIVLTLTGLALAFPAQFSFVYLLSDPIGSALTGVTGLAFLLALHRFTTFLLVALVAMHIYASFIFHLASSMVYGRRNEIATV